MLGSVHAVCTGVIKEPSLVWSELRFEGRVRLSHIRGTQRVTVRVDIELEEDMSCRMPSRPGYPGCRRAAGEGGS